MRQKQIRAESMSLDIQYTKQIQNLINKLKCGKRRAKASCHRLLIRTLKQKAMMYLKTANLRLKKSQETTRPHSSQTNTFSPSKNFQNGQFTSHQEQQQSLVTDLKHHKQNQSELVESKCTAQSFQHLQQSKLFKRSNQFKFTDFIELKQLGKGRFGIVSLALHSSTGFICALKKITKKTIRDHFIINQVSNEIILQSSLSHPNIIQIYGVFQDQQAIYLILQAGIDGSLYKSMRKMFRMEQVQAAPLIKYIGQGCSSIHAAGIIHRDIKAQNIVMLFDIPKICDFGWACQCKNGQFLKQCVGTPLYYSPQMLRNQQYNSAVDIWALGFLAFEIACGWTPFKIWTENDLHLILDATPKVPESVELSESFQQIIFAALAKDQFKRPTIEQFLSKPCFKIQNKSHLIKKFGKQIQYFFEQDLCQSNQPKQI